MLFSHDIIIQTIWITYKIDENQIFKGNLEIIDNKYSTTNYLLDTAYKTGLNEKTNFILGLSKNFATTNVKLTNVVEYRPTEDIEVKGAITVNTDNYIANSYDLGLEKEIMEGLKFKGIFSKKSNTNNAEENYGLTTGVSYEF